MNLKGTKEQRLLVNGKATATLEDGVHYVADQGKASVELNKNISFTGGATEVSTHDNIGVIGSSDASGNGILNIRLAKDINLGEGGSFTAGGVKVDGATNTVTGLSNTKWNLDQVVDSRAATEGQLRDLANTLKSTDNTAKLRELERDVNRMDTNIRDAGATAAALAGLKPIQYDPEKTTQAYGAVGAYRGREAIAFGLGHYLNQDMLIHAGIGIGAHKMANAGFSMKFGFGGEERIKKLLLVLVRNP